MAIRLDTVHARFDDKPIFFLITVNNYLRFHWNMDKVKGLNPTSELITIGVTTPTFTAGVQGKSVDLQLNPLDREVFVVQAVEYDFAGTLGDGDIEAADASETILFRVSISTTERTSIGSLSDANVLSTGHLAIAPNDATNGPAAFSEQQKPDTAASFLPYIGILATSDFFVQTAKDNDANATTDAAAFRIYGYRAKVSDAAIYASLVQSEVLSS